MEEIHRARYVWEGARSFHAYRSSSVSMCSATRKLSELRPFEFLWSLHYLGMIA